MKNNYLRILLLFFIPWIGFSQTNKEVSAETLIQEHLSTSANQKKLQSISYEISRDFVEPDTKIRRIYVQQKVNGISVKGAVLNINYAVNGKKAIVDSFKKFNVNTNSPSITAESALRNAMIDLGNFNTNGTLVKKDVSNTPQKETTFEKGNMAADDFKARLVYLSDTAKSNKAKLTWETQLYTKDRQNYWLVYVDATSGQIISKQDLVLHCSFGGLEYDFSEAESKLHKQHEHKMHMNAALEMDKKIEAKKNKNTFSLLKESMLAPAVDHQFKVLAFPAESPIDFSATATQTMVSVLSAGDAVASPYGWNKTTGAEFQDTKGNNVYSFYDASPGPLGGAPVGATPPTTAGGAGASTWDYMFDLTEEPEFNSPGNAGNPFPNRTAAIVNLFYINNMMHDIFYGFGFNEENRNFQEVNNFAEDPAIGDRGGLANDGILAQAQDGGGTNNANMLTLADGTNGQMQMYLWTAAIAADIVYIDQNTYDTDYDVTDGIQYVAVQGSFPGGPQADTDLSRARVGNYIIVEGNSEGSTPGSSLGCGLSDASGTGLPYNNQSEVDGQIAVIDRGDCSFVEKVVSAQLSGAIAAVVINNIPGSAVAGMGGTDTSSYSIDIPSVMISNDDGKELKAAILAAKDNGEFISGQLFLEGGTVPKRDGSFDNGVIAHEYGHGISTRLSIRGGGLGTLGGDEQGGEGWSDFWGLYTTLRLNDLTSATDEHPNGVLPSRGIGNYVTYKDPTGAGIRPRPYSVDPSVNGYTYAGSTNGLGISGPEISVPHGVGFVWCTMLYTVFQEFVDVYGFNDDIFETGLNIDLDDKDHSGGNNVINRLIMEGLKIQPASGSFADQRDAILAADALLFPSDTECGGSKHFKMIWEGFAKRGLGFQEDGDYGTNALGDERDSFGIPPACGGSTPPVLTVTHSAPYLVTAGENIQYDITVTVTGGTATDLVIVDQIPTGPNLTFESATDDISPDASNQLIWNVGDVLSGSSVVKTVIINTSETVFTTVNTLFEMESATGDGIATSGPGVFAGGPGDKWVLNTDSSYRGKKAWFVKDPDGFSEQFLRFNLKETTVADEELVFFHRYATEAGFDGGVVEYTTNGAAWIMIDKADFTKNGYNDTAPAGNNTQIVGDMFGGNSGGYIQSIASLPAGVTAVRFRFASDVGTGSAGWWIDDFMVGNTPTYAFSEALATSTLVVQTTEDGNLVTSSDFATSLINDGNALAVDDIDDLLDINVSLIPNPARSKVSIVWSDNIKQAFTVEMVTLKGQLINVWKVKGDTKKFDINLESYAKGFYIIKIQRNDKVTSKKLIIN